MLLKIGLGIVALFAVLGLAVAAIPSPSPSPTPTIESTPEPTPEITQEATPEASPQVEGIQVSGTQATVARVIDGDTIELSTGERVRYIGVDTPETVDPRTAPQCLGKEASNKNKELVEGKAVTLEKDVSETDRYGRLLRYVYVDGKMINEALVAEGFAKASSYPPDVKHQEKFRAAEQSARNN
ncbi:MAG: thermonuclease family protein, partial [Candidatus Andersenbacteria bacterium]